MGIARSLSTLEAWEDPQLTVLPVALFPFGLVQPGNVNELVGEGMGFIDEPILDGQPVRVLEINRTESHPVGVDYSGENPHTHIC